MHFTLAISIAMAAVAGALPQGPGGSRAIVGWCVSVQLQPTKYLLRTIETNHHLHLRLQEFQDA